MASSDTLADPARRAFVKGILAIGAAGGLAHNLPTAASIASDLLGDISAALGPHRLLVECHHIREKFVAAKSGELMAHYQTFWPLVLNQPEFLAQLEAVCKEPSIVNDHRRRVLPAVAALHSSAASDVAVRDRASSIIHLAHDDALHQNLNREVLEILWQNAIAAIIRNEFNWRTIKLEERFLSQGLAVCRLYLNGERALFMAAMSVFHAMLVYRLALRYRARDSHAEWLDKAIGNILDLEKGGSPAWFDRLRVLFDSRTDFGLALPQMTEILMGHAVFSSDVADFAIAMRVHHYSLIKPIASGEVQSRFLSPERASSPRTLALLIDYGVTPEIWSRVRGTTSELLNEEALHDADVLFSNYDALKKSKLVLNHSEAGTASLLAARVPFRNQPERSIVEASMNNEAIESVAKNKGFAEGLPGLLLTAEFLQTGGKRFDRATYLRVDKAHGTILQEFPDLIKRPLSIYDDWLRELPVSATTGSTHVGMASGRSPSEAAAHSPSKMAMQLDADLDLLRKEISDTWKSIGISVEAAEIKLLDHLENPSEVVPQWNEEFRNALNLPDSAPKNQD